MKLKTILVASIAAVSLTGCFAGGAQSKYQTNLNNYFSIQREKEQQQAQFMQSAAEVCQNDANPGLCVVALRGTGESTDNNVAPPPRPRTWFENAVTLAGALVPYAEILGEIEINDSNNDARVRLAESDNRARVRINESDNSVLGSAFQQLGRASRQENGDTWNIGGSLIRGDGNGDGDRFDDVRGDVFSDTGGILQGNDNFNSGRQHSDNIDQRRRNQNSFNDNSRRTDRTDNSTDIKDSYNDNSRRTDNTDNSDIEDSFNDY